MGLQGKSKRGRERLKLALPVRVQGRETAERQWVELSRLIDVTPFGARFSIAHPIEPGLLLHLTLPMPRQLRCFDHIEDQYRVWALIRNINLRDAAQDKPGAPREGGIRFEVGVAFTGKHPPASYLKDPMTRYEVETFSAESSQWRLKEKVATNDPRQPRSQETRLQIALGVLVEVLDDQGQVELSEQTVTENLSRRGAAVWTTLKVERGRFVRLTSAEHRLSVVAAVRANRPGPDGIPRLHLEFIDRQWPLDGVE
jgi:hypothetical protein